MMGLFSFFAQFFQKGSSGSGAGGSTAQLQKLGRNDLCHCGSHKKYKHCHLEIDRETRAQAEASERSTQLNRAQEPNWGRTNSPEQDMAQHGLNNASNLKKKK